MLVAEMFENDAVRLDAHNQRSKGSTPQEAEGNASACGKRGSAKGHGAGFGVIPQSTRQIRRIGQSSRGGF